MKRALFVVAAVTVLVQPLIAFDPHRQVTRRATVLQPPAYAATRNISERLVKELKSRGFDAVESAMTLDEVQRSGLQVSGVYVELAPSDVHATSRGDVAINAQNLGVDLGMIASHVAAELRVYDGRTYALIAKKHLSRDDVRVVPTGVGVGSYRMSMWFALPWVQSARNRAAANAVVRDAVVEIESITAR